MNDRNIEAALAEYETALDEGQPLNQQEFLERYAEIASELEEALICRARVTTVIQPLQNALEGKTEQSFPDIPSYTILAELGCGGMGVVYKAREEETGRTVALKLLRKDQLQGRTEEERHRWISGFREEIRILVECDDLPNIVPMYKADVWEGTPFYTMKLVKEGTLADRIEQLQEQPLLAAEILMQVARAIHAVHRLGILHCDLKPGNILIHEDVAPLVTDFGLAKRINLDVTQQHTEALVGTIYYMPPEPASSTAADIFSLGAILYECLTGQRLRSSARTYNEAFKLMEQPVPPPSLVQPEIDRNLENICLRCLQLNPDDRYPSAEALAEDLDRYRRGGTIRRFGGSVLSQLSDAITHREPAGAIVTWPLIFWAGGILAVIHLFIFWIVREKRSESLLWLTCGLCYGSFAVLIVFNCSRMAQLTRPERLSSIVVSATALSQVLLLFAFAIQSDLLSIPWILAWYPALFVVTGLCDYVHGFTHWGWMYLIGLAQMPFALLVAYYPTWGPVTYASVMLVKCLFIGTMMRKFGRDFQVQVARKS